MTRNYKLDESWKLGELPFVSTEPGDEDMAFREIEFLGPLRRFLESYPALGPEERLEVCFLSCCPAEPGNGFAVERWEDVLGRVELDEKLQVALVLRRYSDGSPQLGAGDFLFNFCRWVNYEQTRRGTKAEHPLLPKYGMMEREVIRCEAGKQTLVSSDGEISELQLLIHLEYQILFESWEW